MRPYSTSSVRQVVVPPQGYVTRYAHNFDFLTIRGSGHMVPQYKPEAKRLG